MRTEYGILRDALVDIMEQANGTIYSDFDNIDDDDLADMAVTAVSALRDGFDECQDEVTNDIE